MTLIKFGNYTPPKPTLYDVLMADVHSADSGRNEGGRGIIEVVREDVGSMEVGWTNLTTAEVETILLNVPKGAVSVTYYNGGQKSASMYRGDRSLSLKSAGTSGEMYWDLSFPLVEI